MAIYHCCIKIGSRGKGQSAVAAAAYRSGAVLIDEQTGTVTDYSKKGGVVFSEIMLCKNAPMEYMDREILWNAVHSIEKASNAQLFREIEVSLPAELTFEEQKELIRKYVKENFVDSGMCADWSIHNKNDGNPHCHIMLTVRGIGDNGEWLPKSRKIYEYDAKGNKIKLPSGNCKCRKESVNDWNERYKVEEWRKAWADACNAYLDEKDRIDHRSYERQGTDRIPMIHEGFEARKIEREGGISERCELNRKIRQANREREQINKEFHRLDDERKAYEYYCSTFRPQSTAEADRGIDGDMSGYVRKLQKQALREADKYDDIHKTADCLTYICMHGITSERDFRERLCNDLSDDESRREMEENYMCMVSILYENSMSFRLEMERLEIEDVMKRLPDAGIFEVCDILNRNDKERQIGGER